MKRNFIFITIMCTLILLLSGCSKNEKSIAEEVANKDLTFSHYALTLSDYEITKRQTNNDDKTDFIWLDLVGKNDDFIYYASYTVTYVKYNDGWQLEAWKLQKSSFSALLEPKFDMIKKNLSKEYTNLEIIDYNNIFSSNNVQYTLIGQLKDNYIDRTYNIVVEYMFTPQNGWCETKEIESIIDNKYNIVGEWLFEDTEHIYYIHISDVDKNNVNLEYAFFNKSINEKDGYWQLKNDNYTLCTMKQLNDDTHYIDVGWMKSHTNVSFADEDYIWFCNNDVTIHGIQNNGIAVNGYFLKKISENDTDVNFPQELKNVIETYVIDYSNIPSYVFDAVTVEYFEFLDEPFEEIKENLTATGVQQKYSLGKVDFLGNQVYASLWIKPEKGQLPGAIELSATGYSCEELREYFEDELNWTIYESSSTRFMTIIPQTNLTIVVCQDIYSATVSIKRI